MNPTATQRQVYTGPIWYVPSSTPEKFYMVGLDCAALCKCGQRVAGLYHCQCPDHTYRARDCRHIRAVAIGAVKPARRKEVAPVAAVAITGCSCDLYGNALGCPERRQAVAA